MDSANGRHQHKIRGQKERLYIFLLSLPVLLWSWLWLCPYAMTTSVGDYFIVPEIPGLQEHHSFTCPFIGLRWLVTTSCCARPVASPYPLSDLLTLPKSLPSTPLLKLLHLTWVVSLILKVSEKLKKQFMRPEQRVSSRTQSDLIMKYIVYNGNCLKESTQIKCYSSSNPVDYQRCHIEGSTMMTEENNTCDLIYSHS